jgi:predicted nucleic acid-binding protein
MPLYYNKLELVGKRVPFMVEMLDPGEAAVISLALAEGIANVCIDDLKGRRIARLAGLRLVGSLGLLLAAKQAGATIRLRDAVDWMRQRNIWLSESLVRNVLTQAGE